MMLWVVVGTMLTIMGLLCWVLKLQKMKGYKYPVLIPVFYNFFEMTKNRHRMYDWAFDKTMQYGLTWSAAIPFRHMVMVIDPKDVQYVLQDNFENYVKGSFIHDVLQDLLGEGIFTIDGNEWKRQRKTASHLFKIRELKLMADTFLTHGKELVEILKNNQDQIIDLQDLFSRLTLDSIGEIAFGVPIGSLHKSLAFNDAFNTAQLECNLRMVNFWWKLTRRFNTKMTNAIKTIDEFVYDIIAKTKQEVQSNPELPSDGTTTTTDGQHAKVNILKSYMYMKDDNGEAFSDTYLRDIALNFLIAGRDTTAQTLSWAFYLLSQNPDVLETLKHEVEIELQGVEPSYENVKDLMYLDGVVQETLRIYPSVPWDLKTCVKDDVLPSGHIVPAGSSINYFPWVMGRHPKFFDNPQEFRPTRWQGSDNNGGLPISKQNNPPFMPFNWGPRTCLGINMAYLEIKIVMCLIIQSGLELSLKPNYQPKYRTAVTISIEDGLWMIPKIVDSHSCC